ncbi:MAG: hypothetical protein R6U66_10700, partial [Bacteroidales bacterium]
MKDLLRNRLIFLVAGWDSGLRYARLAGGLLLFVLLSASAVGQNVGDYQTVQDGNWSTLSTWERYDGATWQTPTSTEGYPGENTTPSRIDIDHNVNLNGNFPNPIGDLYINSGLFEISSYTLRINGITNISGTLSDVDDGGTLIFNNDIIINEGAVCSLAGNLSSDVRIYGNIVNNSNNVNFTRARVYDDIIISGNGSMSFSEYLEIQPSYSITNQSTISITLGLNSTGGQIATFINVGTLYYGGSTLMQAGSTFDATAIGNIVEYNGNANQTIRTPTANKYYNLITNTSGTKTITSNIDVDGDLTINPGTTLEVSSYNFNVAGSTDVYGTFSDNNSAGIITFHDIFIDNGATWTSFANPSANLLLYGNIVNNSNNVTITRARAAGNIEFSGNGIINFNEFLEYDGSYSITNQTTINVGEGLNSNNLSGTFINEGTLYYSSISNDLMDTDGVLEADAVGNTIIYNGDGDQNIIPPSSSYYNLELAGTTAGQKTSSNSIQIDGNLSIQEKALFYPINDVYLKGNWTNSSSNNDGFDERAITLICNGTSQQTFSSTGGEIFDGLEINNPSGISLGCDITVTYSTIGTLTMLNGNITGNGYSIYLSNPTPTSLNYTSGAIIGAFERAINTESTYLFPVGNSSGTNHNTSLQINTITTGGSVVAEFIEGDPGSNGLPLEEDNLVISQQHTTGYWSLLARNSFSSSDYSLELDANSFSNINAGSRIIKRTDGGAWLLDGTHTDATGNTVKRADLTGDIYNAGSGTQFGVGNSQPKITSQPIDQTDICIDASANFSITATGRATLSYQWYKVGTPDVELANDANISGAATNNLTISNVGAADAGN